MADLRHELGNLLSIAQSSVDAMLDGVAPVSDARLQRLREILAQAGALVNRIPVDAGPAAHSRNEESGE